VIPEIPPMAEAVKNRNRSQIPLKGQKFAGWEGGKALRAPAQETVPRHHEFTAQTENIRSLSGGAQSLPPFPTCDFRMLLSIPPTAVGGISEFSHRAETKV
jgi:hypothetical protein